MNAANVDILNGKVEALLKVVREMDDVTMLQSLADGMKTGLGPSAMKALVNGNGLNPFFAPSSHGLDRETVTARLNETLLMARMSAAQPGEKPNILVACAPKSGSTFLAAMLAEVVNVTLASLTFTSASQKLFTGTFLREQEFDELAILIHGVRGKGYVAQHHLRCTPYLCKQMEFYQIRPIVTYRNVFDCLVSMDDMFLSWRDEAIDADTKYFKDGLPSNFPGLEREQRLTILAHRHAAWYLQFFLSWKRCEAMGLVKPLWISYERDFLGPSATMAEALSAYIGPAMVSAADIEAQLVSKSGGQTRRLNKGVAGRGADIPASVRALVHEIFAAYTDDQDVSELLEG